MTEELIKKYLYTPVEGETINTDRESPPGYPYIKIDSYRGEPNRQNTPMEHVALLDTGQLVYMDIRSSNEFSDRQVNLGTGIYHHTVVRK